MACQFVGLARPSMFIAFECDASKCGPALQREALQTQPLRQVEQSRKRGKETGELVLGERSGCRENVERLRDCLRLVQLMIELRRESRLPRPTRGLHTK